MKLLNKITNLLLILVFLAFAFSIYVEGADLKVRVTVNTANIRLKPSLESTIIGKARRGEIFKAIKKIQDWYEISLPPTEKRISASGYVHRSVVEEIVEEAPPQKAVKAEPEKKPSLPEKRAALPPKQKELKALQPARKKFFVRFSGGYASKAYSYDRSWSFSLYHEDGQVAENYSIDSSGVALDAGIGYLFSRNIGIELSFVPASGKTAGSFTSTFPHPFYFNFEREKTWEKNDLKYSASEINFNIIFSTPLMSKLHLYLGGGGTYFLGVKIENLKVINWSETGYPYLDLSITPEYATYSQNCFGFNASGGLDFFLKENIALNLNVRYSSGEAKIDVEGEEVAVQTGGIKATAGIKFTF